MLKIATINVRGLHSPLRHHVILNDLKRLSYDVYFIQETHINTVGRANMIAKLWKGQCFWSFSVGRSAGVAIWFNPNFTGKIVRFLHDSDGRILSILVQFGSLKINLINIYAPNVVSERKVFFSEFAFFFFSGSLVVGGDFNCFEYRFDKLNAQNDNFSGKNELKSFRTDFRLCDVWRKLHPKEKQFTWFNANLSVASRLDKFFISDDLFLNVSSCNISPCPITDHDFVFLSFDLNKISPRGPGIWRFNTTLLKDPDFRDFIAVEFEKHRLAKNRFPFLAQWWDDLKTTLKFSAIAFSNSKRKSSNAMRELLTKRLICLKNRLSSDTSAVDEIKQCENNLAALISRDSEGVITRSRTKWIEEGEKPTRYFFQLEKERAIKNTFLSVFDENGVEHSDQKSIERIQSMFYKRLFSKEEVDLEIQAELVGSLPFSLSFEDSKMCDGLITFEELTQATKNLPSGKTPGSDGLPLEFYSAFWDLLGPELCSVLNDNFSRGFLSSSQREGIIRLIHKKDDPKDLKNWRPISLLNTDYKLASKVMAKRLKRVLPKIVHSDQTCGVPGRTIFSNLAVFRDILDYIEVTNETGILVSLDQEKAFDRVDHDFLQKVLQKLGFGSSFCSWISTFYFSSYARVISKCFLTQPITLERGVRQGCPISPLLYVLISEVLGACIRQCPDIKGFQLPGVEGLEFKLSQYADDSTSIVKDERSLCALFKVISRYERGSGAKLNLTKTEGMWLGAWRNSQEKPFGIRWVNKMTILGTVFFNGSVSVERDNWRPKLDKLSKVLNLWKRRDLSFVGRALIVNILGASKFWYLAKVLIPPSWVIAEFKSITWNFIWRGKMECVSRERCCAPLTHGGLGILDFEKKCKSLRLSSFHSLKNDFGSAKWHYLAKYFIGRRLSSLDNTFNLHSNLGPSAFSPSKWYDNCLALLVFLINSSGIPNDYSARHLYRLFSTHLGFAPKSDSFWLAVFSLQRIH